MKMITNKTSPRRKDAGGCFSCGSTINKMLGFFRK
jgi:hypothetical protein